MNKKLLYLTICVWLISCATAGKIKSNVFFDDTYPFTIGFPENYDVSAQPSKSIQRVVAIMGSDELTSYVKPMFMVSISLSEKKLDELINTERDKHFEPRYYMGCVIENEENIDIHGLEGYIIYFGGSANKAATVLVKDKDYFIKIEYIADSRYYSEEDLTKVLSRITFTQKL
jgi:hypothetical protein